MNGDPYSDRVEELAKNGKLMGESPTTVATRSIVSLIEISPQTQTLQFSAEPFVDDPSSTTRLFPQDVINGTERHWQEDPALQAGNLRELAVRILAADICDLYDQMDQE